MTQNRSSTPTQRSVEAEVLKSLRPVAEIATAVVKLLSDPTTRYTGRALEVDVAAMQSSLDRARRVGRDLE